MIQWFTDALLLNVTADADGTPDRAKVSSEEFLFNLSAALLKLCQPFVNDPKKTNLVDPGFVSSPESHGGVYDLKGDNALPRLGANISDSDVEYNPKNSFIPLCFFFCSRSLALSIIPGGNRYKSVAIHVSHAYHDIRQENGDARTNRRFNALLAHQYMKEIIMKSQAYITDAFRFYNMAAGIFLQMEKEVLKTMPEHFVADMCTVLVYGSKFTPKFLSGVDFGNLFRLTVKLLSKDCAHVSLMTMLCLLFTTILCTHIPSPLSIASSLFETTICVQSWEMCYTTFSYLAMLTDVVLKFLNQ